MSMSTEKELFDRLEAWKIPRSDENKGVKISLVNEGYLCMVSGATVHLQSILSADETSPESIFVFDEEIDCVGWTNDGSQVLAAGDRAGHLHFICPKSNDVFFSQALASNTEMDTPIFADLQFLCGKELLVLLASGKLIVCRNLSPLEFQSALHKNLGNGDHISELQNRIQLSQMDLCADGLSLLPVATPSFVSTGSGEKGLCLWRRPSGSVGEYECYDSMKCLVPGSDLVQSEPTSCGKYLITLSDSGVVSVWLLSTLVMVNIWAERDLVVKDFSTLRRSRADSAASAELCDDLCVIAEDGEGKVTLSVVSLPHLHVTQSLEVCPGTRLFHGKVTENTLYYVDSSSSSSVCVVQLVQALPQNKLTALLSQQKFAEAEVFAIKHDIDCEVVYKSEAKHLKEQLVVYTTCTSEALKILESWTRCLDKIHDQLFIMDMVLGFSGRSLEVVVKVLLYASKKLNDPVMLSKVTSALNKVPTYRMIHKDTAFSSQSWLQFLASSPLVLIKHFLRLGDLQSASCVHTRHMGSLVLEVDEDQLLSALHCVPENVHSDLLGQWLASYMLPFTLQHLPQALGHTLSWIVERIKLLEQHEKEGWPGNGHQLANIVIDTVSSFKNPSIIMGIQPRPFNLTGSHDHNGFSPLFPIKSLQSSLDDISYLQSSLECPVTLSEYQSEPREAIVYRLLDKVLAAEVMATTIRSKVVPYLQRHMLKLDTVLLKYLKLFLARSPWQSAGMAGSPFESKAVALVRAIQDKQLHVTGCLELLQHLQVPWSEGAEELVKECVLLDLPQVALLKKQYRLLQLRKLLSNYNIKDFNFSDLCKGEMYVRKILASGQETALKDALEVADMYQLEESQVYKYCIVNMAAGDKMEMVVELFASLSLKLQAVVAQKTLALSSCKLQQTFYPDLDGEDDWKRNGRLALLSLEVLQRCLRNGSQCVCEWHDIAAALDLHKRLLALQVECSVFISPQDLGDRCKCEQLFDERLAVFVGKDTEPNHTHTKTIHNLYRFCSLLGFTEDEVTNTVALKFAQSRNFEKVKKICRDVVAGPPSSWGGPLLLSMAQELWGKMRETPAEVSKDDMEFTRAMSAIAVSSCHDSRLMDAIRIYNLCTFLLHLYSQCAESAISGTSSQLEFCSWAWSHRYRGEGLVLEQAALLPLAVDYAYSNIQVPSAAGSEALSSSAMQLGELLEGSGHTHLALRCTVNALSMLSQKQVAMETILAPQSTSALLDSLTTKVLSAWKMDHDYALSLLLMFPVSQAVPRLEGLKAHRIKNYSRAISLCKLSQDYGVILAQPVLVERVVTILRSAEWGKRLGKFNVPYTKAFRGGLEECKKVGGALLRVRELDLETVIQYCCEELGQPVQSVLLGYLRIILTEWAEPYEARAAAVMSAIANKSLVTDLFASLLKSKVQPYAHQKVSFLLNFLREDSKSLASLKVEQGLLILDCLRHYKRVSTPGEYERKWYAECCSSVQSSADKEIELPELATRYLPFHPLLYGDPMEIIGPELSLLTVETLTAIARILKLPMDNFYSSCISRISHVTTDRLPNFDDLAPFLDKIRNKTYSLAIAKWLAHELGEELDKAKALTAAISIAMQCRELASTESEVKSCEESVKVLKTMLALSQVSRILQEHQLDQPVYLDLTGTELIMRLYTDIPVSSSPGRALIPVHAIATEIAALFEISLNKIRTKLCEQWLLSFGSKKEDMDLTQMSILEDPTDEEGGSTEDEERLTVKRLVYLLNVPDKLEAHSIMLLNWAKRTTSPVGNVSKVRALQVLFALTPPTMIEAISGTTIANIRDFMQSALFVCELEGLHMNISLVAFLSCLKEGLVKTLWKNHAHKPKAMRLIAELCIYYGIGDGELWHKVLLRLHDLAMLPYLRYVLKKLASRSINVPGLDRIWHKTLTTPFETMLVPLSLFQKEECDHTLAMVYECPFPFGLDLGEVVVHFTQLGLRAHALSCMLMIPWQQEREQYTKLILEEGVGPEVCVEVLQQASTEVILASQQVKEVVYLHLDQHDLHETLLGTAHFPAFVQFLVSQKLLNKLLLKTLSLDRVQEAVQLVELYNSEHGSSRSAQDDIGMEALKEYVSQHSSFFHSFTAKLLDIKDSD